MDRELLIEIGTEELPASWLLPLTRQLGECSPPVWRRCGCPPTAPRNLQHAPAPDGAGGPEIPERQADVELITGPAVAASFGPDGAPASAAAGFARKHGVEVAALRARQRRPGAPTLPSGASSARPHVRSTCCPTCCPAS